MKAKSRLIVKNPKAVTRIHVEILASFTFLTSKEARYPNVLKALRTEAICNEIIPMLLKFNLDLLAGNVLHDLLNFFYVSGFDGIKNACHHQGIEPIFADAGILFHPGAQDS